MAMLVFPLFANVMMYGLFIVIPLTLLILGIGIKWVIHYCSSVQAAGREQFGSSWTSGKSFRTIFWGILVRSFIVLLMVFYNFGVLLNDPAEGDGPPPTIETLLIGALICSLLCALAFGQASYSSKPESMPDQLPKIGGGIETGIPEE